MSPLSAVGSFGGLSERIQKLVHDQLNLLVALQGAIAELEAGAPEEFAPLVREFAALTERAGRLARMVKDPDASVDRSTQCSPAAVLLRAEPILRRVGEPFPVRFDVMQSGAIGLPDHSLERIAVNLVRNARYALSADGRIDVSLKPAPGGPHGDPRVVLAVADTGGPKGGDGEGLGLIVVHELVAWAGGRLEVARRERSGWCVRCDFPEISSG